MSFIKSLLSKSQTSIKNQCNRLIRKVKYQTEASEEMLFSAILFALTKFPGQLELNSSIKNINMNKYDDDFCRFEIFAYLYCLMSNYIYKNYKEYWFDLTTNILKMGLDAFSIALNDTNLGKAMSQRISFYNGMFKNSVPIEEQCGKLIENIIWANRSKNVAILEDRKKIPPGLDHSILLTTSVIIYISTYSKGIFDSISRYCEIMQGNKKSYYAVEKISKSIDMKLVHACLRDMDKYLKDFYKYRLRGEKGSSTYSNFIELFPVLVLLSVDVALDEERREYLKYFIMEFNILWKVKRISETRKAKMSIERYKQELREANNKLLDYFIELIDFNKIDPEYINGNNYEHIIRLFSDSDFPYEISNSTLRIFVEIIRHYADEMVEIIMHDNYPTFELLFDENEIRSPDTNMINELRRQEEVSKIEPAIMDFQSFKRNILTRIPRDDEIDSYETHYILDSQIIDLMQRVNNTMKSIGNIPKEFLIFGGCSPHRCPGAFDVNLLLNCYYNVKIKDGFTLDYIYAYNNNGGEPLVYSRKHRERPFDFLDEYFARYNFIKQPFMLLGSEPNLELTMPYTPQLIFENTPFSVFQFGLMCMNIRRFYLHWHSNYNDRKYLLTQSGLNRFIANNVGNLNDDEVVALKKIDCRPTVNFYKDFAKISIMSYEENIGYSFAHILLKFPNIFIKVNDNIVIKSKAKRLY